MRRDIFLAAVAFMLVLAIKFTINYECGAQAILIYVEVVALGSCIMGIAEDMHVRAEREHPGRYLRTAIQV